MKKILIFLISLTLLASCGNSAEIEAAKKAMLEWGASVATEVEVDTKKDPLDISDGTWPIVETEDSQDREDPEASSYEISESWEVQLLKFNELSVEDINNGEVEISWATLWEVDKITVSFKNEASEYPDDLYTLKTFKSGWDAFKYLASSRFKVLDFGMNTYVFTAYTGRESVETTININLVDDSKIQAPTWETDKLIGTEVSAELSSLPTGWSYGNPVMLWEDAFTYSDINGLEISKTDVREISCDSEALTDYLSNNINTWFYWNTCRDLLKDKAISFNVLRINGEQYTYQKHYVDFINSFYGTYDIETGTWVTKENIKEKNAEFKERNDSFSSIALIDSLFTDIAK